MLRVISILIAVVVLPALSPHAGQGAVGGRPVQKVDGAEVEGTEVRGRFVLANGDPAPEADVFLDVRRTDGTASVEPQPLVGRTDDRGWFKIDVEPPERALYTLTVRWEGHVEETWRWSNLSRGELFDLGKIELRPAGRLHGRVLSRDGLAIAGGWSLSTEPISRSARSPGGARRIEVRGHFEAVGSEEGFRLEGLPPGECRVLLDLEGAGRIEGPTVNIVAGEDVEVDVIYDGPDLERRIHIELSVRPVYPAYPSLLNVRLHGPEGARHLPLPGDRARRSLDFDGLDPEASYTLEVDDPDFEPFVLTDLRPGNRRVRVTLTGSARLSLLVEDGETGDVLEDFDLYLILGEHSFPADRDPWLKLEGRNVSALARAGRVLLKSSRNEPLVRGRLRGLIPGDHLLLIQSEGFAPTYAPILGLDPDEDRAVRAALVRGGRVTGLVHLPDDRPRPGVRLALFAPGDELRLPLGRIPFAALPDHSLGQGYERSMGVTRADGTFDIGPVSPGTYVLVLRAPDGRRMIQEGIRVTNRDETALDITFDNR